MTELGRGITALSFEQTAAGTGYPAYARAALLVTPRRLQ